MLIHSTKKNKRLSLNFYCHVSLNMIDKRIDRHCTKPEIRISSHFVPYTVRIKVHVRIILNVGT